MLELVPAVALDLRGERAVEKHVEGGGGQRGAVQGLAGDAAGALEAGKYNKRTGTGNPPMTYVGRTYLDQPCSPLEQVNILVTNLRTK